MTRTYLRHASAGTLLVVFAVAFSRPGFGQQSVTLSFDWPAELHAQVQYTATRSRTVRGQSQQLEMRGTYDVDTESVEDGLLVKFRNLEVELPEATGGDDPRTRLRDFLAKAGTRIPDYVVDENGRILRMEGVEEMRANVEAALAQIAQSLPEQSRGPIQEMIRKTLSRERLEASVRETWNRDVGSWNGATLEVGQRYEKAQTGKAAMLGGMDVPMKVTYQLHGRRQCNASAEEEACVELELRSFVDSASLSEAFDSYLKSLGGGQAQPPKLANLTIDQRMVLLTEPDTLIPHSVQTERTTSVTFSEGGVEQSTKQLERKTVRYRYR